MRNNTEVDELQASAARTASRSAGLPELLTRCERPRMTVHFEKFVCRDSRLVNVASLTPYATTGMILQYTCEL